MVYSEKSAVIFRIQEKWVNVIPIEWVRDGFFIVDINGEKIVLVVYRVWQRHLELLIQ